MAKLSYYLDTRSGSGTFPLKMRIAHKGDKAYILMDISLTPEQWDGNMIVNHKSEKTLNDFLIAKKTLAESTIMKFGLTNDVNKLTAQQIKNLIDTGGEQTTRMTKQNFLEFYEKKKEAAKKNNTKLSYESAINRMMLYDPLLSIRTFDDINLEYIEAMDAAWEKAGLKTNSRAVYMRNIRAIFNMAIKEKKVSADLYPFSSFSIKKAATDKRNLSVQELRLLRDYPIVNAFQEKYRDLFMLCFYMRGINMVDLLALTKKNVRAGRINYIRSKTGKFYSVKIEPEMSQILKKYRGTQYLIDVCDGAKDDKEFEAKYKGFLQRMDRGLKKIGPYERKGLGGKKTINPILPDISQYWCRHTTATLMAAIGYREEIIVCSLGHEHKNKVTNIYIEYNEADVDKANRALIDFVNGTDDEYSPGQGTLDQGQGIGNSDGVDRG